MPKGDAYNLGKTAFLAGKLRDPMKDHKFLALIQGKRTALDHPNSPGAEMTEVQRRKLEERLNEWLRGWDDTNPNN